VKFAPVRFHSSGCGHFEGDFEYARIRRQAPDFTATAVVDNEFKKVSLSDYKGKWVYLFFYPLDFTFVCPTEIIEFSTKAEEFKKAGVEVLGCSVDSEFVHLAWVNTPRKQGGLGEIKFPLISDITHEISKKYGVFIEEDGHTIRGSFIIDNHGVLRHFSQNDNSVGRNVTEALRLVQGYIYSDAHPGEVCPINWTPGAETMKADPKGSQTYFAAHP